MLPTQYGATFAAHRFELGQVGDRHFSAAILNQALHLESLREQRHGGPAYAERGGDPVLRGMKALGAKPLTALHQPAAQPLLR